MYIFARKVFFLTFSVAWRGGFVPMLYYAERVYVRGVQKDFRHRRNKKKV